MSFYNIVKNIVGLFFKIIYRFKVEGKENITKDGKLIICSNHIHNLDPLILSIIYPRQINWMAKKQLFENKILSKILYKLGAFPVDRDEADLSTIKKSLKILKEDNILGIFPEGTRVKEINLNNAKAGVSLISIKSQTPVLPIFIESNYKLFSTIKVYIGEPLDFSDLYGEKLNKEDYLIASQKILKSIYSIKDKEAII